ncbi:MAG: DUF4349 domain-containing protein [Bacteroidetes bacterium]|nr:DUF4349 domain-containing protein [Bacteroidota bacterium]
MKNLIVFLSLFLIISCGNASRNTESNISFTPTAITDESYETAAGSDIETKQTSENGNKTESDGKTPKDITPNSLKLIKNGYLTIEVDKYKETRIKINEIVKKNGGYMGNESETNETYRITNDITIRIPSTSFDKVMELIIAEGIKTDTRRIEVTDVGEEYADLNTRLATKRAVEKRYLEILTKAGKITDILEVEEKLRIIREEIEAAEGRIKYLDNQISYSTIQLSIYKTLDTHYTPPSGPGFFTRIWKGFVVGWEGLVNFFIGIIYLWPLWIIITLIIFWIRKRKIKFRLPRFRKKQNQESS